jgi:hypothetical protein
MSDWRNNLRHHPYGLTRFGIERLASIAPHPNRVKTMHNGRLIRVSKCEGDASPIAYIVAVSEPLDAIELIRSMAATPNDEVEDFGRVSDALLMSLHLETGSFVRL